MKPIYLECNAFGPFAHKVTFPLEQISGGVFLIHGATGTGKTTIFDAICFALFGNASGEYRQVDSFRSDFATDDVKTSVILKFSHNGNVYEIYRSPAYRRKKQRGEGYTDSKAEATLFMPDGSVIVGYQVVTEKIEELLSLDWKQFKQISMIAQGEFLKLLTVESKERGEIFRKVFHTGNLERVGKQLKEKMLAVKRTCEEGHRSFMQYCQSIECPSEREYAIQLKKLIESKATLDTKEVLTILQHLIQIDRKEKEGYEERISILEKNLTKLQLEQAKQQQLKQKKVECEQQYKKKENEVVALLEQVKQQQHVATQKEEQIKQCRQKIEMMPDIVQRKMQLEQKKEELKQKMEQWNIWKQQVEDYFILKNNYESLVKKLENSLQKQQKDMAKLQELEAMYIYGQAGILASKLEEGMPCPVCGSLSHPKLAKISDVVLSKEQLEEKREECEIARKKVEQLGKEVASQKAKMESFVSQLGLTEGDSIEQLVEEREQIRCSQIRELYEVQKQSDSLVKREKEAIQAKEEESRLEEKQKEEKLRLQQLEAQYQVVKAEREILHDTIQKMKQEVSDDSILEEITALLQEKEAEKRKYTKQYTNQVARLQQNEKLLEQMIQQSEKQEQLQKQYSEIAILSQVANGELVGKEKLPFEQYVQAFYFEQVVEQANVRLRQMSGGRYALARRKEAENKRSVTGLELEVMDYFTGKTRSVKSLSGGETFKAALSLALGLSDVIQKYAGGIVVETMFIDEGFGSLDKDSLEQAISVLKDLATENRMVGIISHVEELKECIEKKIVVTKDIYGKGSTIKMQL